MAKKVKQAVDLFADLAEKMPEVAKEAISIELTPIPAKVADVPEIAKGTAPSKETRGYVDYGTLSDDRRKELFPSGRSLTLSELKELKNNKNIKK